MSGIMWGHSCISNFLLYVNLSLTVNQKQIIQIADRETIILGHNEQSKDSTNMNHTSCVVDWRTTVIEML